MLANPDAWIDQLMGEHDALASSIDRSTGRVRMDPEELATRPGLLMEAAKVLFVELGDDGMQPRQRPAFLAWMYANVISNGGHFQFFVNRRDGAIESTILALEQVGCARHADLLREAGAIWTAAPRQAPSDAEEFCTGALAGEFERHDELFGHMDVDVHEQVGQYVNENAEAFVSKARAT